MRALATVRAYIGSRVCVIADRHDVTMETTMPQRPTQQPIQQTSLIMIQFLAWVADRPRNYAQTMDAWRSSCPRLSVWEDAIIDGLIRIESNANRSVRLTPQGAAVLAQAQPQTAPRRSDKDRPKVHAKMSGKSPVVAHAA